MSLPGWTPRWFIRLLDFVFGGESYPAMRCECGAVLEIDLQMTEEQIAERVDVHNRFFHPERLDPHPKFELRED